MKFLQVPKTMRRLGATGPSRVSPALLVVCGFFAACGGSKKDAASAVEAELTGQRESEASRCAFQGRDDRDVQESSAPGSVVTNVRRVYGYVGTGQERRRVLLCREVDTNFDGVKDLVRTYGDHGQKLTEVADTDYDGKVDTWITFGKTRPIKMELDRNGDGKPDEVRHYVGGQLSRVQIDTNGDGEPDVFEVYIDGRLDRIGIDADFDGQVDRWDRDEVRLQEEAEKEAAEQAEQQSVEDGPTSD